MSADGDVLVVEAGDDNPAAKLERAWQALAGLRGQSVEETMRQALIDFAIAACGESKARTLGATDGMLGAITFELGQCFDCGGEGRRWSHGQPCRCRGWDDAAEDARLARHYAREDRRDRRRRRSQESP